MMWLQNTVNLGMRLLGDTSTHQNQSVLAGQASADIPNLLHALLQLDKATLLTLGMRRTHHSHHLYIAKVCRYSS